MKHKEKKYVGKKDNIKDPDWIKAINNKDRISDGTKIQPRRISSKGRIQFNDGINESGSNSTRKRRSKTSNDEFMQNSRSKSRKTIIKKDEESNRKIKLGKIDITLGDLRESLSDKTFKLLLNNKHNPNEIVTIKYEMTNISKLAEDSFFLSNKNNKRRRINKVKQKLKPPSEMFGNIYKRYLNNEIELSATIILSRYFILYKKLFGEEDPEFVGKSVKNTKRYISYINEMTSLLAENNYEKILEYINLIMPLWAKQLKIESSFPNRRPTFKTFFINRKIWSQRYLLVRQWKN